MDPPNKKFKQSNDDVPAEKFDENDIRSHTLLQVFVNYLPHDTEDEYQGFNDKGLTDWLTSEELNVNTEEWYLSTKLDIRTATKTELLDELKSNEDIRREHEQTNNSIMYAKVAYELKSILPILLACNNNVKFVNEEGKTILHVFIEECLMNKELLSEEEINRLQKLFESLIKKGASFFSNDKNERTPIEVTTSCKDQQLLQLIISNLKDKSECDNSGNGLLHILIKNCVGEQEHTEGLVKIIQGLISKCENVNIKNNDGVAPVHLAAEKFQYQILKALAENGANFNETTNDDRTALHFSCRSKLVLRSSRTMTDTIELLVSEGVDVEAFDKSGFMAFHYAIEFSTDEVIEKLMQIVKTIDCRSKETLITPLYLASRYNRLKVMKKLVEAGAYVDSEASDGTTALFMSTLWGTYDAVKYLIDKGSDIYKRDRVVGFNLLHMAAYGAEDNTELKDQNSNETKVERKRKKIDFFIGKEFDVDDSANCNITPIQLATLRQNYVNVKILIEKNANVNFQADATSLNALHLSILVSNWEIAKLLLENKAEINCRGGRNLWSPLHMAVAVENHWDLGEYPTDDDSNEKLSYLKTFSPSLNLTTKARHPLVPLLLGHGASLSTKDYLGRMPIHLSLHRSKNAEMVELLRFGARVNVQDATGEFPLHVVAAKNDVEKLQLLLICGGDIYDQDTSEIIMKSNDEIKNCAIKHSIKFHLLGFQVAKVYEAFMRDQEYANFYEDCANEVKGLANYYIVGGFSLYDFLRAGAKIQYLLSDKILNIFEDMKKKFPNYATTVAGTYHEANNRNLLLNSARIAWYEILDIPLPQVCLENILSCLTNRYLEVFTSDVNNDKKLVSRIKVHSVMTGSSKCAN